ncbi:hypothetical protein JTB14_002768 [Gonioctena quinquepunctata]|nr:hypothetical protein JTB14_002768 [Gonioctena quinquepunctata]
MKVAEKKAAEWMLNVLNGLLLADDFPPKLKLARLLLTPKESDEAMDEPTASKQTVCCGRDCIRPRRQRRRTVTEAPLYYRCGSYGGGKKPREQIVLIISIGCTECLQYSVIEPHYWRDDVEETVMNQMGDLPQMNSMHLRSHGGKISKKSLKYEKKSGKVMR